MTTFRGIDFFGSGPHRVVQGAREQTLVAYWVIFGQAYDDSTGTESQGDDDVVVTVRGRLVGATEADLWDAREALMAEVQRGVPAKRGDLVDADGRVWADLVLVGYAEDGPIDRGRVWSVGYSATFRGDVA
ncbi:MAG: hypothetical protein ACF8Q5_05645 [Phycisphaerales bacterium JB040]